MMNINKPGNFIRERKKWGWMGVCLCIGLLSGCRQEVESPDALAGGIFLSYKSAAASGEAAVRVRSLVFAGTTESDKVLTYNAESEGATGKIPLQGIKLNDIHTVINSEKNLESIRNIEDLQSVRISENLPDSVNDPARQRYYCFADVYVHEDGKITNGKDGAEDISKTLLTTSEYTMAKMKVEFDLKKVSDMTIEGGIKLVIQNVKVKNVPSYGYLIPKAYDGTTFKEINGHLSQPASPSATSYTASAQVLVPEYIRASGEAQKMTLVVTADRFKDGTRLGSSEYEVPVGNAIAPGADQNNYNIDRNKVYTFKFIQLTGAGTQVDDWVVDKSVTTWEEREVDTEVGDMSGFFLETTYIDNFRAFRLPRYVSFKSIGGGRVKVDLPTDQEGRPITGNEFSMDIVWDDATHKSGKLALRKGNWRTSEDFIVKIKLRANNIEKTLVIRTVPAQYAKIGIQDNKEDKMTWIQAMNYTKEVGTNFYPWQMNEEKLFRIYSQAWQADGPTGCAAYFEGSGENDPIYGKGCWRVSTIREGLGFMKDNGLESRIWAYEMMDNSLYNSYTAKLTGENGDAPPSKLNMFHPSNNYFPPTQRNNSGFASLPFLCVLDDKLEMNYNVGVNASDHPVDVTFVEAEKICNGLREGGFTDWRLPTVDESMYALQHAGTQGIPNNFTAGLYWRANRSAAGVDIPMGTDTPFDGVANVRCVRTKWEWLKQ